ncbi:MAG: YkgJ family cysteine cluster protein [Nitrospirales bacterium]|nr:YkgJ family cysteine cluster protein [Nitrospirales bacterium]
MNENKIPSRHRFPEDELRHPWLPLILDAYEVIDEGIKKAIEAVKTRRGALLACAKGCSNCCTALSDIPLYPLEMVAIYWYAIEKVGGDERLILMKHLAGHKKGDPCPFLIERSCSIHPMRPIACRQFNVFDRPCSDGEDPFHTRRKDVLTPWVEYTNRAFSIMLPFYGVSDEEMKAKVIKQGLIHTQAMVLQGLPWAELAKRMDEHDLLKEPAPCG